MRAEQLKDLINRYTSASFTINRRVAALMRVTMPDFLTQDQYSILQFIKAKPDQMTTSTELAGIFCVGKSSITAIVARLEAKGLLRRQEDDRDRRVTRLHLTEEGERLAAEVSAELEKILGDYLNEFEDGEAEQFIQPFEKLARLLKETDEGRE